MYQYLEKIKQRANYSASVMETVNHLEKTGQDLQSRKSRGFFYNTTKTLTK
jgi:hypothetical protein